LEGGNTRPRSKERTPDESPALLCTQYAVALQQCSIALQGFKNETESELLYMFQECLKARNFPVEPSVCRRSMVSPDEAAKLLLKGRRSGIPDFHRYQGDLARGIVNARYPSR
jgi:hypothetical protein